MTRRNTPNLLLVLALSACAAEPERRPVEALYREALDATRLVDDPADAAAQDATASRRAAADAAAMVVAPSTPARADGPLVSDVFLDTDIRQALQSLASQAGARVVVDDAVRGTVTATLEGVPLEEALADVLAPHGYVFERVDGRYLVGSVDPASPLFPALARTTTYTPRHLTTQELMEVLPRFAAPYVSVSGARNLMTITAPRELGARIHDDLARADRPVPQVVLEVIVCEFSPETKLDLGFDFAAGVEGADGKHTNIGMRELQLSGAHGPPAMSGLLSFEFASAFVRALASEGYVSIRAAPRVMVRDGEAASIAIGEETFFTVSTERFVFQQLQTVRSGITLDLTPRIGERGVAIKIDRAEVSDELRPSQILTGDDARLPSINTRRVSTTVTVRDGETVVIGGLVRRRQVERLVKVPFLGDIPGLGVLFQRRESRDEETEVAIFLSPRIVR